MTTYINQHLLDEFQKAFQDKLLELLNEGWRLALCNKGYYSDNPYNNVTLEKDDTLEILQISGDYFEADRWSNKEPKKLKLYFGSEVVKTISFMARWSKKHSGSVIYFIPDNELETVKQKHCQRKERNKEPFSIYEKEVNTSYIGFRKATYRKIVTLDYYGQPKARMELVNRNGKTCNPFNSYNRPKKVA